MSKDRIPELALVGSPAAFCSGVERILGPITKQALDIAKGRPVKALHEPVHNPQESDRIRAMGIRIVDTVDDIDPNDVVIPSAHGTSLEVMEKLRAKRTTVVDGVCPLVRKTHQEVHLAIADAKELGTTPEIIFIGKPGHQEAIGTIGQAPEYIRLIQSIDEIDPANFDPDKPKYIISQTTLLADKTRAMIEQIREIFPDIKVPRIQDICFATQNRQDAVEAMIRRGAEALLVLGADYSSNTQSLMRYAQEKGASAHLFPHVDQFSEEWVVGKSIIGITAGASASPARIRELTDRLQYIGVQRFETVSVDREEPNFTSPARVYDYAEN